MSPEAGRSLNALIEGTGKAMEQLKTRSKQSGDEGIGVSAGHTQRLLLRSSEAFFALQGGISGLTRQAAGRFGQISLGYQRVSAIDNEFQTLLNQSLQGRLRAQFAPSKPVGAKSPEPKADPLTAALDHLKQTTSNNSGTIRVTEVSGTVSTGNGAENVAVDGMDNAVKTGAGNDNLAVGGTGNTVNAGSGNDNLAVLGDGNSVRTGGGSDTTLISGSSNTVKAGGGSDKITLEGSNNAIAGGGGGDTVFVAASAGGNTINGGSGRDTVIFEGAADDYSVTRKKGVTTYTNVNTGFATTLRNVETVNFTA